MQNNLVIVCLTYLGLSNFYWQLGVAGLLVLKMLIK